MISTVVQNPNHSIKVNGEDDNVETSQRWNFHVAFGLPEIIAKLGRIIGDVVPNRHDGDLFNLNHKLKKTFL